MMQDEAASITIGNHTLELPRAEALSLFAAAVTTAVKGGPFAINSNTLIVINRATHISVTAEDEFRDVFNQQKSGGVIPRPRTSTVW